MPEALVHNQHMVSQLAFSLIAFFTFITFVSLRLQADMFSLLLLAAEELLAELAVHVQVDTLLVIALILCGGSDVVAVRALELVVVVLGLDVLFQLNATLKY